MQTQSTHKNRPRGSNECSHCGCQRDRPGQRLCLNCHATYMRQHRPKYRELTPEQRLKSNARSYANSYERRGLLHRKPCQECGSPDSEKHHEDYSKPCEVKWLCRKCHLSEHATVGEVAMLIAS